MRFCQLATAALLVAKAAALSPRTGAFPSRGIVRLVEKTSGTNVLLVGTMHYNPASSALAASTIHQEAEADRLRAVLIELCASRWNSSNAKRWTRARTFKRFALEDEFQVAFEAADDVGLDVELADQPVEETVERIRQVLQQTANDMFTLDGWRNIVGDVRGACLRMQAADIGIRLPDMLSDFALLLGAPVALIRYPLASPTLFTGLLGVFAALSPLINYLDTDGANAGPLETSVEVAVTLVMTMLLARVVLVALIEERNAVLAAKILEACRRPPMRAAGGAAGGAESVVAVMGMVHVNGVVRLLTMDQGDKRPSRLAPVQGAAPSIR
mmetsp:Transcript_8764/g.18979  ORF Transcript_8764/g.18979 Transcript_8764/m.18979 type:complete len:328 (-) Transcript_8764:360-1343(-)